MEAMANRLSQRRRRGFGLWGILVLALALGCTRKTKNIDVELPDGSKLNLPVAETLRVAITSEPPSLDYHKSSDTQSTEIITNLMEGLTQYDLADKELKLKPALALKWESSDQARKWKFTLREGVQWSDGVALTAQHVVDGFKRSLSKETAGNNAYFLFGVKNAQAFNRGSVPWDKVGVKATAPNEISIELERPMSYFPYLLTHHSTFPVRLELVQKHGHLWTEAGNLVSIGPFVLKAWQHDKMIVLERNEKYYDAKPAIKYVAVYMIQEKATEINLFDSGQLDAVRALPSIELRKLRTRKEYREANRLSIYYYGFNVSKAPLNNVLVRKAVAMAIDRNQVVQMLGGGQHPLSSWIPSGMFGYEPEIGLSFNPEKARELLKQAGYPDPAKLPKIEIKFNTLEDHSRIAENVQAQLKKNLGIAVELKNEEWKVYLNSLKSDAPPIFRMGWQADYPDPDNFLNILLSYSDNNYSKWKNSKYDSLVLKGAGTVDKEARRKIYVEALKLLVEEEVPVVPLFTSVSHLLVSPRAADFPINAMEIFAYKGVRLEP